MYFKSVPGRFTSTENIDISDAEITEETTAALLKYKKPWIIKNQASGDNDGEEDEEGKDEEEKQEGQ